MTEVLAPAVDRTRLRAAVEAGNIPTLLMVLHHLTVLPDLVSAYFEFTEDLLEAAMDEAVEKFHQLAKRKVT